MTVLYCYRNQLTNLDVSKNINLTDLNCDANKLTSLDVTKNTVLIVLSCGQNQLTNLDATKNTALTSLYCNDNQLTNLDVTKNTALTYLDCYKNQLTNLDVTKNTALRGLSCYENQLSNLNLKNGNNTIIGSMVAYGNPNLSCIQVDNVSNASSNSYWKKDAVASYNTSCNSTLLMNDIQKYQSKIYPNPVKNILSIQTENKLQKVEIYSTNGQLVKTSLLKETYVGTLPKGNYIVKITTDKEVITEKFIKE